MRAEEPEEAKPTAEANKSGQPGEEDEKWG
jgi:hypothetical protein